MCAQSAQNEKDDPDLHGNILVVDDDASFRAGLGRIFKRTDLKLLEASNGYEALDILKSGKVDLVLADMMMPILDGEQFLQLAKEDSRLRSIPIIIISGLNDISKIANCLRAGAEDYLVKPFNSPLLMARLKGCLEKKRLHDQERHYLAELKKEKQHVDELLEVIFPKPVIQELKEGHTIPPRSCDNAAVLFADVVNFTKYCDLATPEQIAGYLQEMIEIFEEIAPRHGVQKIKTIGDCFMGAAGLWDDRVNASLQIVKCAVDMVRSVGRLASGWQIRVGIHCGPVMTGVIGRRQYLFDIWGDTVNVAARVQSVSKIGQVAVTQDVMNSIKGNFGPAEKVSASFKGKGEMDVFYIDPNKIRMVDSQV